MSDSTTKSPQTSLDLAATLFAASVSRMDSANFQQTAAELFKSLHGAVVACAGEAKALAASGGTVPSQTSSRDSTLDVGTSDLEHIEDAGSIGNADASQMEPVREADGLASPASEQIDRIARPAARSLQGSTVVDPTGVWMNEPQEDREHFTDLAKKFGLEFGENGYPMAKSPDGTFGGEETMYDPMTGEPLDMLKRRLKLYNLSPEKALAMFGMPKDMPLVSKSYSERKRIENLAENRALARQRRPAQWDGIPIAKRRRYRKLAEEHSLDTTENGLPLANTPGHVIGDAEGMYDPFLGSKVTGSFLRHMQSTYGLDKDDIVTMFGLPEDQHFSVRGVAKAQTAHADA